MYLERGEGLSCWASGGEEKEKGRSETDEPVQRDEKSRVYGQKSLEGSIFIEGCTPYP